jgi:PKD repeat protein
MKKFLFALLGTFILFPMLTFASGKMIIGLNESIILDAQSDLRSPEYKWVLLRGEAIIHSYTGKQFTYLFQETGEFQVNLVVTSKIGEEAENSFVEILVGATQDFADSLDISLQTLPRVSQNNIVLLPKKSLNLSFILSKSKGDVSEYRIDADTQKDSDNDGDAENDIDNLDDPSYGNGDIWTYSYEEEDLPTSAKITLIDSNQAKEEVVIQVQMATKDLKNQKLKAVFESFPQASDDKRVHLYEDEQDVILFAGNSFGDVLEYRIDTDIETDSDGDGKMNNDIDNLNHASFKTGENFPINIKRVHGDMIMQLTIVSAEGKGSLIQKKFVWKSDPSLLQNQEFRLFSETDEAHVGDAVHFGIEGVIPNTGYEIKWDFNGDKESDLVSDLPNVSYVYAAPGDYEVLAQIKHEEKQILKYGRIPVQITEKPLSPFAPAPESDFQFEIIDNEVIFTNTSQVDESLEDKTLKSEWKFGDGTSSDEESPRHVYQQKNNYVVRLIVSDINGETDEKSSLIEIQTINEALIAEALRSIPVTTSTIKEEEPIDETENNDAVEELEDPIEEEVEENGEKIDKGFSFLSFVFWAFVLLTFGVSGLLIVYIIIQKIKHPDYSFGEILEEEKEKILSALEGREYEPPHGEIIEAGKGVREATTEILDDSEDAHAIKNDLSEDKEVKEPVVVEAATVQGEASATPPSAEAAPLADQAPLINTNDDVAVPDWMKDDSDTPSSTDISESKADVESVVVDSPEGKGNAEAGNGLNNGESEGVQNEQKEEKSEDEDIPDWLK